MMRSWILFLLLASIPVSCVAQLRVLMSAVEAKTGRAIHDLQASEIVITDDKVTRPVTELTMPKKTVDVMLLLDTGLAGALVQSLAYDLIDQLAEPEAMAVVSFDDTAQLIQDFTSSRPLLKESISKVRYGNRPKVLDALAAAIGDGFDHATYRRVVLLLTAGYEGGSLTSERKVVQLARKLGVSIFPIYMSRERRGLFESLARQTGGATFNLISMAKDASQKPAPRIFEAARNPYLATIGGNANLSERMKLEARRHEKIFLSALPVE
jgi:arginine repressor